MESRQSWKVALRVKAVVVLRTTTASLLLLWLLWLLTGANFNQWVQQLTVGGVDEDGNASYNLVTVLCLRASRRLPLNAPVLSLRLYKYDRMPEAWRDVIIREASMTLLSGGAHPVLLNDDKIIPGLVKSAVQTSSAVPAPKVLESHARNYACDGCYEPMFVGRNWFMLGGMPTLLALEYAMNQGMNLLDAGPVFIQGKVCSFRSKPAKDIKRYEELEELFFQHLQWAYAGQATQIVDRFGTLSATCPAPLLSTLMEGCMEKGRDLYAGGCPYNVIGPCFTALSSTINSLWAIKTLCFEPGTTITSLPELLLCLKCDWGFNMRDPFFMPHMGALRIQEAAVRFQALRRAALALPRWGRAHPELDKFGNRICKRVAELAFEVFDNAPVHFTGLRAAVRSLADRADLAGPNGMGMLCLQPGIGTFEGYMDNGAVCGASADGRLAGSTVGSDLSPTPSPLDLPRQADEAAILAAMRGMEGSSTVFWNGAPVDKNVAENFPLEAMQRVLIAFANGHGPNIMTITVADTETFAAAQAQPERFDTVRIRTGGWTEFYTAMSDPHQQVHYRRPRDVPSTARGGAGAGAGAGGGGRCPFVHGAASGSV
jgi:pyruvate-formate lyase